MDKPTFVDKVWGPIQSATSDFTRDAQLLILAHTGYETGWGVSRAFRLGRNLFNITRVPSDPRPVVVAPDLEYSKAGVKNITQRFAAYDSYEESVKHYLDFIRKTRYVPAYDHLKSNDLERFVITLSRGGYFTLPWEKYLKGMSGALSDATRLTEKKP